ncbi:hypothetical protein [Roseivivax marinus]|uniref:hypothetical protein n=1 Tax=Roseivivax marinus TaxID=1379903 RepID=UPI00273F2E91|nr:hypothetical protein [Roseivivax marinus]
MHLLKTTFVAGALFSPFAAYSQSERPGEGWYFAESTEFMTNVAWNYSPTNGMMAELGVECIGAGPVVYFADGLRHDGDTRPGRVSISIDGRDFSRAAIFEPHGHTSWWRMAPDGGLLSELQAGNTATLQGDLETGPFSFKLRGSSAAIGSAVDVCGSENAEVSRMVADLGSTEEAYDSGTLTASILERRIQAACQGSYNGDSVIVEANIDGDGRTDYLLDWEKVSCSSNAVGRGGGNCGTQMCSIDVYASSVYQPEGWPQPILAYSYELAAPGEDHVMTTTVSGADCPITHRCTRYWGWTGSQLDVVRDERIDVSEGGASDPGTQVDQETTVANMEMERDTTAAAPSGEEAAEEGSGDQTGEELDDEYWENIGMRPNQWNSVVPESGMGFVLAFYPSGTGAFSASLSCGPSLPGLGLGVGTPEMTYENPDFGPEDDVYVRLDGQMFKTRFHEDIASGGDPMHLQTKWEGQVRLLQLLASGADMEVVIHPGGDASKEEVAFTIPGSANDPGLAHVYEVCGDGPEAEGDVESFPGMFGDGQSGVWVLRNRTENFTVPVAQTIDSRNGASFRLLCSEDGTPSMQLQHQLIRDGEIREVALRSGGQEFRITGHGVKQSLMFPLDDALVDAMNRNGSVTHVDTKDGDYDVEFPTSGVRGAMDFAFEPCR